MPAPARSRILPVGLCLAVLATATAACDVSVGEGGFSLDVARASARDEWRRTYDLDPGGRLELINVNGRITATPADGNTIELVAERTAKGSTEEAAKTLLGQIEMREEAGPGRVRVEVRAPRSFGMTDAKRGVPWPRRRPRRSHDARGSVPRSHRAREGSPPTPWEAAPSPRR